MPDQIDPKTGWETFVFMGQRRYRCPCCWESGARCKYDTYDVEQMHEHIRQPHTRTGNPAPPRRVQVSPILDADGKPIVKEFQPPTLPADFETGGKFRKSA